MSEKIVLSIQGVDFFDISMGGYSEIDIALMGRFGLDKDECFWHNVRLSRKVLSLWFRFSVNMQRVLSNAIALVNPIWRRKSGSLPLVCCYFS